MADTCIWEDIVKSIHFIAASLFATLAGAGAAAAAELTVQVAIDTEVCASVAVQCGVAGQGHTFVAAASTNHNPIRVFVQVSKAGAPVAGLTLASFNVSNSFVPAGGGSAGICSTTRCGASNFAGGGNGTYTFFLDRIAAGNWKKGAYGGGLKVTSGVDTGAALINFRIP
jgi:hypothetical protein